MMSAADASPPLDFSFRNLTSVKDLGSIKPRHSVKRYRKSASGLYDCYALRLNNNHLMTIRGIHAILYQVCKLLIFTVKLSIRSSQHSVLSTCSQSGRWLWCSTCAYICVHTYVHPHTYIKYICITKHCMDPNVVTAQTGCGTSCEQYKVYWTDTIQNIIRKKYEVFKCYITSMTHTCILLSYRTAGLCNVYVLGTCEMHILYTYTVKLYNCPQYCATAGNGAAWTLDMAWPVLQQTDNNFHRVGRILQLENYVPSWKYA